MTTERQKELTTDIIVRPEQALAAQLSDQEALDTLWNTIAPGLNQPEQHLFLAACRNTGLNPFVKQIYAMKTGGKNPKMSILVGIDGFRLIAQRTGQYDGQDGPYWCGPDGVWRDVWVHPEPPVAAKVTVYRKDAGRGFTGIANYAAYVQTSKDYETGKIGPNSMWQKMHANQTAKCAEALALRKAFPAEMSGLYTEDEMGQAQNAKPVETGEVARPAYPWLDDYKAAMSSPDRQCAPRDIAAFFGEPDMDVRSADFLHTIQAWLRASEGPLSGLLDAVAGWTANSNSEPTEAPVQPELVS